MQVKHLRRPAVVAAALAVAAFAVSGSTTATAAPGAHDAITATVPHYDHVVVAFMENETASQTFEAPAAAPHLAQLRKLGSYVPDYYGAGHASLDNYIALFGGEQPTTDTEGDCLDAAYSTCVYPATVPTLGTSLTKAGKSWKIYSEGMTSVPGVGKDCLHNAPGIDKDTFQGPGSNGYATRHNPAMWYAAVTQAGTPTATGDDAYCDAHSVDYTQLATDDQKSSTLPAFSFVEPDTCHDGHDAHCAGDTQVEAGGTVPETVQYASTSQVTVLDDWTYGFTQKLLASPAWQSGNNLLVITFDESLTTGTDAASGCAACKDGSAGGRVGALFIGTGVKKGYVSTWKGDHYGLLRTLEDSYGLKTLKSQAATPTAAATVHDGDPGVTPVTDIFGANPAAVTAPGTTTTTTTTGSTGTTSSTTTVPTTTSRSGSELAFTGLSAGVPIAALVLVGGGATAAALRRRRS